MARLKPSTSSPTLDRCRAEMATLRQRQIQAEKRGRLSPFAKGDPVTLVLRIAYDWQRAAHLRNLRINSDALSRKVQSDLKNAEFVWRPTAQDIRWSVGSQDTVEVFWSSRAQSVRPRPRFCGRASGLTRQRRNCRRI
jgi:hypothetical protein